MRAIQVSEYGGPEVLRLCEVDQPTPGDGEVLYDVLIPRQLQLRFLARGAIVGSRDPSVRGILTDAMKQVVSMWGSGALTPTAVREVPLAAAGEAHAAIDGRTHVGKYVLRPS